MCTESLVPRLISSFRTREEKSLGMRLSWKHSYRGFSLVLRYSMVYESLWMQTKKGKMLRTRLKVFVVFLFFTWSMKCSIYCVVL